MSEALRGRLCGIGTWPERTPSAAKGVPFVTPIALSCTVVRANRSATTDAAKGIKTFLYVNFMKKNRKKRIV